jgi:hypothetical protein
MSTARAWEPDWEFAGLTEHLIDEAELEAKIKRYEEQFGMSSEEFLQRWNAGDMPDTFETNAWSIILDFLN